MTVPALITDNIGAFAWWRQDGCYSVELSDVLDYVVYYEQQPEYVDTILFLGINYGPINVRIRSDGYILAWYSKEWSDQVHTINSVTTGTNIPTITASLSVDYYYGSNSLESNNELAGSVIEMLSGTHSGKQYLIRESIGNTIKIDSAINSNGYDTLSNGDTFRIYSSRAALVYSSTGTSLGYAIKLIWDQLRSNQIGGSGDTLNDYTEVNNYDYEYTNATSLHIFGYSGLSDRTIYMTQPSGNTIYTMYTKVTSSGVGRPSIVLNNTTIVGTYGTGYYPNMNEVDITLLRSTQVRNTIVCDFRTTGLTGYFYLICLTND